jgi:DNA-binding transcriptional ArsR family regulator
VAKLSRPAASQHLTVLLEAGLLQVRAEGRNRWYRADQRALTSVRSELELFWEPRLDALREAAEA